MSSDQQKFSCADSSKNSSFHSDNILKTCAALACKVWMKKNENVEYEMSGNQTADLCEFHDRRILISNEFERNKSHDNIFLVRKCSTNPDSKKWQFQADFIMTSE